MISIYILRGNEQSWSLLRASSILADQGFWKSESDTSAPGIKHYASMSEDKRCSRHRARPLQERLRFSKVQPQELAALVLRSAKQSRPLLPQTRAFKHFLGNEAGEEASTACFHDKRT